MDAGPGYRLSGGRSAVDEKPFLGADAIGQCVGMRDTFLSTIPDVATSNYIHTGGQQVLSANPTEPLRRDQNPGVRRGLEEFGNGELPEPGMNGAALDAQPRHDARVLVDVEVVRLHAGEVAGEEVAQ